MMGGDDIGYREGAGSTDPAADHRLNSPSRESITLDPYLRLIEAMLRCSELEALRPPEIVDALEAGDGLAGSTQVAATVAAAAAIAEQCLAERDGTLDTCVRRTAVTMASWWVATVVGGTTDGPAPKVGDGESAGGALATAAAEALEAIVAALGHRRQDNGDG
jgi:hypothetical protein